MCYHIVTFVLNTFYPAAFARRKKLSLVGFLLLWFGVPFFFILSFQNLPLLEEENGLTYWICLHFLQSNSRSWVFKCEKVRGPPFSRS